MKEYFVKVSKIEYKKRSNDPLTFRFYNPDEVIDGKTFKDHLRFAMSYWHTLCGEGQDIFGQGTQMKSFGATNEKEAYINKAYVGFEIMNKLGIDYFCFHDKDIAPEQGTLTESHAALDEIAGLLEQLMKEHHKKLLWGTANLTGHKRFVHGAATSSNADVFAFAAAKVKKTMEITAKLGGEGFVFWGGREGYATLMNTNTSLEQDNYARLLTMARDYAKKIGFKGYLYIEPKPMEPMTHQYDYDVSTVLAFLRKYGLQDDYKVNVEANHATLARHRFAHELRVARDNGIFGSIDINQGEMLNGWDTDNFPNDVYEITWAMYEVIKAGGFTKGGLNFDAKLRRASTAPEDIFHGYITGMDTVALGYKIARRIIQDGRLDRFVDQRYASYRSGIGARIVSGQATLEELETYALAKGEVIVAESGGQEYLEGIINDIMFGG